MLSFPDFEKKRILVIFSIEGQKFAIQNDNLIVRDLEEKIILQDTCYRIFSLWIVGNCSITSVLLKKSKLHGFSIVHLSTNFRMIGRWGSQTEGNFLLRYRQYQFSRKDIAKRLVENKIYNQIELLTSIRKKDPWLLDAINQLREYQRKIAETKEWKELLGLEGIASKVFFGAYYKDLNWTGRKPRTKIDSLNAILDIGYTFLFYWIENMLDLYGFDVYKGVYHQNFYQRKSLVCDLIEPFRCIIDAKVRTAYNLGQFKEDDFIIIRNQYHLKKDKAKSYMHWLQVGIIKYKDELYYYVRDYYRAFNGEKTIEKFPFFKIK